MKLPDWLSKPEQLKSTTPEAQPQKESTMDYVKGIDVSHYTVGVDFRAAKADGVQFCYAKATDGNGTVDSEFRNFRSQVKDAGLLFGGYHFLRYDYDIQKQIDLFLGTLAGVPGELQPVLDVEWDNTSSDLGYHDGDHGGTRQTLDEAGAIKAANAIRVLQKAGYSPLIYTNAYFFTEQFQTVFPFFSCPLWISNYQAKTLADVVMPPAWNSAAIWQYKGDKPGYGVDEMDFNYLVSGDLNSLVKK